MKWFDAMRAIVGAAAAVLLVVLAMWIWMRADALASAIASSSVLQSSLFNSPIPPTRLVQAVQAFALAAGAGGQALLLREVVPMFYSRRWMDELLQIGAGLVVVAGLLTGIVLLVESGG